MFFDKYCELCKKRNISPSAAAIEMGISKGTVSVWKNRGNTPQTPQLQKIAEYFEVTTDYLLGNEKKPAPVDRDGLTAKDRRDIARDLERMMASIEDDTDGSVMFDGNPLTDGARETLRNAIAMGLEYAKKVNKETYTPKKYKKSEE